VGDAGLLTDALDALDRKILRALQEDATRPLDELATLVGSSKTPVWNRIRKLKERGVIKKQVAVLDPRAEAMDSDREVVSNIHARGVQPAAAARQVAELLAEFVRAGVSGVQRGLGAPPPPAASAVVGAAPLQTSAAARCARSSRE